MAVLIQPALVQLVEREAGCLFAPADADDVTHEGQSGTLRGVSVNQTTRVQAPQFEDHAARGLQIVGPAAEELGRGREMDAVDPGPIDADYFNLTQEFLAQMQAVRRPLRVQCSASGLLFAGIGWATPLSLECHLSVARPPFCPSGAARLSNGVSTWREFGRGKVLRARRLSH
ncbi:MAG: hypothetical protein M3069_33210 [Chloroflexota bacterium]|nr:hypothetical protein [Chloroflexota bacterium]